MADNMPSGSEFRTGRSDSTSSTGSATSATGQTSRRSSHTLFEGLTAQKRKDDPISIARRQSMSEQRPNTGFIGKMWNKYDFHSFDSLSLSIFRI
ncbi:hypothetical protein C8A05DRAFT_11301 [Staphylotrichum tortipilum]|uniref:Conidiation-specific protein 8 n=1 Tax=Staphylotrichum tortipilum TaxID=2831512 RepID=A0AAN6MTT6_9PEZI|nr:hypothetical protein C8A05DRAFT_11301 [Staphylotrichum longicolle]